MTPYLDLWELRYEILKEFKEACEIVHKPPQEDMTLQDYERLKTWALKLYCTIDQLCRCVRAQPKQEEMLVVGSSIKGYNID